MCMLGWDYRFCEKLNKSDMIGKEAEKFTKKFDKIYKNERIKEIGEFKSLFPEIFKKIMRVYDLIYL